MSKYHSRKITKDGQTFDSVKEYRRYCELLLFARAGAITNLQRQVKYLLIPAQYEPDTISKRGTVKRGKVIERECAYFADFVYIENGKKVVEDTKGVRTSEYIMKRKLMLWIHGIRIKET